MDSVLGGGFPLGSLILVAGNPGTGKTVFSAQFLYQGAADYGEPGVYASLSETRETFMHNMRGFGFDFESLERKGLFRYLDLLTVKEHAVPSILSMVVEEASRLEAKRLVIDSYSALAQAFKEPIDARIVAHTILGKLVRRLGCTTIMVVEVPYGQRRIGLGIEEFVADGILKLDMTELEGYRFRELEVLKLRGAELEEPKLAFTLKEGFKAFQPFNLKPIEKPKRFEPVQDLPDKYSTGSRSLDEALGGGLPKASVTLLELDEKISTQMYHLILSPLSANFALQGRGVFILPSFGVDPLMLHRYAEVYGGTEEEWARYVRIIVAENFNLPRDLPNVITLKGEDWREDREKVIRISKQLAMETGQPNLTILGVDTIATLYGEKKCVEILNLSAAGARSSGATIIAIVKAGFRDLAIKLSSIADVYLRLTREHGCLLLYGVKPRTGLYAVEPDMSKGYPLPKLTPIV